MAGIVLGSVSFFSAAHAGQLLLYQIDTAQIRMVWLQSLQFDARRALREEKIAHNGVVIAGNQVRVTLRDPGNMNVTLPRLKQLAEPLPAASFWGRLFGGAGLDLAITDGGNGVITIQPTAPGMHRRLERALTRSMEIIRRRIDPEGKGQAIIQAQGQERISIWAPGLDSAEVKARIETTARLTFQLVDISMTPGDAQANGIPPDDQLLPEMGHADRFVLVRREAIISGDDLLNADGGYDMRAGPPEGAVNFEFNSMGAAALARATRENIGKPFAIILDNKVISAPMIRSEIPGGRGQITGNFSLQEAGRLVLLLRSGALPATLSLVEERPDGP